MARCPDNNSASAISPRISFTLDARYFGQKKSPFSGKMMATFRAETIVNRGDFGVTWNAPLEAGGTYLGERAISPC